MIRNLGQRMLLATRRRGLLPVPAASIELHDPSAAESHSDFAGWLVSFPRSGSTWFRMLLGWVLLFPHDGPGSDSALQEVVPDIYGGIRPRSGGRLVRPPIIAKSHQVGLETSWPVVSLHRRPDDALVSYWARANEHGYVGRHEDPDVFAMANLGRWIATAEAELRRVRSGAPSTILQYEFVCVDPVGALLEALDRWRIEVDPSAARSAVAAHPPANRPHGYSQDVLSRQVRVRIERASSGVLGALLAVDPVAGRSS